MKTVPEIRFPEYTEPWEQRKLNQLADYTSSSLTAKDANEDGLYDLYDANSIIGKTDAMAMLDNYITIIKDGAGVGRIRKLPKNTMFIGTMGAITTKENDLDFIYSLLERTDLTKEVTGSTIPHIYFKDYGSQHYYVPSIDEQRMIGGFFSDIDNLITLHQRESEQLRVLKRGLLQKMFPREGQLTPEIRFPGFTEAWKQRKLGELYIERNERGNESLQILSVSIHTGVSDGALDEETLGKVVKRSEDKTTYKHVYVGDLVFNMMRAWQGAIGVAKSEGMISPAYISAIPNDEVYPLFMDYALRRDSAISEINNLSYGVTDFRKRLYWDSFVKVGCMIPSVDEQRKIYVFFKNLDNLIALHQREHNKLSVLKHGLLQKMFV